MRDRARPAAGRAATYLVLALGALLAIVPFAWELSTAFKSLGESIHVPPVWLPTHPGWHSFAMVFENAPFARQFANTVAMSVGRTAGQLLLCSMAGYAFARLSFPGRRVLFGVFLSILMVPSQLFIIPQYRIMQELGWLNSLQALVVPGVFSAFGTFLLRQYFLSLPDELGEAAELDGCSPLQTYWHVYLPLARPGLIALGVLTLLWSWNDLLWPLIVNTDPRQMTLSAGLASLKGQYLTNYPVLMAGAVMATLPMIVVFAVLQRQVVEGVASTGTKG
ncbi:MAG TPA: carbohydrate ABC transporter permease [Kribbella sp.]